MSGMKDRYALGIPEDRGAVPKDVGSPREDHRTILLVWEANLDRDACLAWA